MRSFPLQHLVIAGLYDLGGTQFWVPHLMSTGLYDQDRTQLLLPPLLIAAGILRFAWSLLPPLEKGGRATPTPPLNHLLAAWQQEMIKHHLPSGKAYG